MATTRRLNNCLELLKKLEKFSIDDGKILYKGSEIQIKCNESDHSHAAECLLLSIIKESKTIRDDIEQAIILLEELSKSPTGPTSVSNGGQLNRGDSNNVTLASL